MVKEMKKIINNEKGFSLLEVVIATAVFSIFVVAYMYSQSANINSSMEFKEEQILTDLAEMKINELILDPPEFRETLTTATKDTKAFEDYPDYTYSVVFKKIKIPDISKIQGKSDEEADSNDSGMQKRIMEQLKQNMEKMIWQISVTVEKKENGSGLTISGWLYNQDAPVQFAGF